MGNSQSLLCGPREVHSPLSCEGEHGIVFESWQGNTASRHVETGISRSFSSCGRKPCVPLACDGDLREILRVPMGSQEYCGTGKVLSELHWVCALEEGLISS